MRGASDPSKVESEIEAMEAVVKEEASSSSDSMRLRMMRLSSRTVTLPMMLLVFLFFTQSFSGSNMVSYYTGYYSWNLEAMTKP